MTIAEKCSCLIADEKFVRDFAIESLNYPIWTCEHINRYKLYFSPPFLGKANSNMLRPQILRKLIHEVEVLIV